MSDQEYPVSVAVRRPDGTVEQVRVGVAVKSGDGFVLRLGELVMAGAPAPAPAARAAPPPGMAGGAVFPNYGRSKGAPITGASMQDLEFYANGCRRSLADPSKSRWHDKEKVLLAQIEAEIARQKGGVGGGGEEPPPHDDGDVPF